MAFYKTFGKNVNINGLPKNECCGSFRVIQSRRKDLFQTQI